MFSPLKFGSVGSCCANKAMDRASRGAAARVGTGSIASPPPVPCWLTERLAGAPTLMVSLVKAVLLVKVAPLAEVDTEPGKNAGAFTDNAGALTDNVGADNAGAFTDNVGADNAGAFTDNVGADNAGAFTDNVGAFTDNVGADNAGAFTDNAGVHVGGPEGGPLRLAAVVVPTLEASIGCVLIADG